MSHSFRRSLSSASINILPYSRQITSNTNALKAPVVFARGFLPRHRQISHGRALYVSSDKKDNSANHGN